MTLPSLLFAAAALIPAITSPAEGAPRSPMGMLVAALCNGGSIAMPLGPGSAPPATAPCCCAKGCRTGARRKRFDPKQ
jgi:hypothetical protein